MGAAQCTDKGECRSHCLTTGYEGMVEYLQTPPTASGDQALVAIRVDSARGPDKARSHRWDTVGACLTITFQESTSGSRCTSFTFTKAPLGVSFDAGEVPIVVREVLGEAARLGVREGMVLVTVGDTDVRDKDYREASRVLRDGLLGLSARRASLRTSRG